MQEKLVIEELDTEEEADSDSDWDCSPPANEISCCSSSDPLVALRSVVASAEDTATHIRSFITCGSYGFAKKSAVADSVGSSPCCLELRCYYLQFLD